MLKKLMKKEEGFTLAELLIVVAIIAVLVAIAIPIFTTQLEKSKETTDIANLRSAYAAATVAAMTGKVGTDNIDESATYWYNPNVDGSIEKTANASVKLGQGTKTNGAADVSAVSGVLIYTNETEAKGQGIKIVFKDGVVDSIQYA